MAFGGTCTAAPRKLGRPRSKDDRTWEQRDPRPSAGEEDGEKQWKRMGLQAGRASRAVTTLPLRWPVWPTEGQGSARGGRARACDLEFLDTQARRRTERRPQGRHRADACTPASEGGRAPSPPGTFRNTEGAGAPLGTSARLPCLWDSVACASPTWMLSQEDSLASGLRCWRTDTRCDGRTDGRGWGAGHDHRDVGDVT